MTFSPSTALALAETLERADRTATKAPWEAECSPTVARVVCDVMAPLAMCGADYDVIDDRDRANAIAIASLRNTARSAAEQLRAACERVAELEIDGLAGDAAGRFLADARLEMKADRDSLRQQVETLTRERDAANEHAASMVVAHNRELSRAQVAEHDRDSLAARVREIEQERDSIKRAYEMCEADRNDKAARVRELEDERAARADVRKEQGNG